LENPEPKTDNSPDSSATGDDVHIVFVHGLGASARKTWIHAKTKAFWPLWLYKEPQMENVNLRLFTFGYNADWPKISAPRNVLDIQGFAKQLLQALGQLYDEHGYVSLKCVKGLFYRHPRYL
jgi:hypothetical protein